MTRPLLPMLLLASVASAHGPCIGCDAGPPGWDSALALALLAAVGVLFAGGLRRIWIRSRRGRAVRAVRAACFAAGLAIVLGTYASPLHELGERLFVAHMLEHEMLMVAAAPLLALSRPFGALVWGLPPGYRRPAGSLAGWSGFAAFLRLDVTTLLHGLAIWLWHVPAAYEASIAAPAVHWLQHASLFGTALLFWHAVARSPSGRPGIAVFCLFATALHTGLLGILLTFAPAPLYSGQSAAAHDWRLTPLDDQQLAGIVMWVPGGMVYAVAALALCGLWIRGASRPTREGLLAPAA